MIAIGSKVFITTRDVDFSRWFEKNQSTCQRGFFVLSESCLPGLVDSRHGPTSALDERRYAFNMYI